MGRYSRTIIVVALFLLMGGALNAADAMEMNPTTSPSVKFSIRSIPPLKTKRVGLPELRKRWNAFRVNPDDVAGFSAVVLPFQVPSERRNELEPLANALAFLLSFDLDWADRCYCSRHAYFIFKRSREQILQIRTDYAPARIGLLVRRWNGTHAIGGRIDGTDVNHLTGVLQVFDSSGKLTHEKSYATPRPFESLLGDMAVDALNCVGYVPSSELADLLHQARWRRPQSLMALGAVAFVEERGEQEFGAYREIIDADPTFAEVRFWLANQSYWVNDDGEAYDQEKMNAVRTRPVAAAFSDLNPWRMDQTGRDEYIRWCEQIERMLGRNAPMCVMARLNLAKGDRTQLPVMLEGAIEAFRRNPHDYGLVFDLNRRLTEGGRGVLDADMAISAALTSMASKAMPGNGFGYMAGQTAELMSGLGYGDDAIALLMNEPDARREECGNRAAMKALHDAGRYAELADYARKTPQKPDVIAAYMGCFAATVIGDRDLGLKTTAENQAELANAALLPLLRSLQAAAEGKKVDLATLPPFGAYRISGTYELRAECELLLALRQDERSPDEATLLFYSKLCPASRPVVFLGASYCAKWNLSDCNGMVQAWAWLHPNDPLNVALANLNLPQSPLPDAKDIDTILKPFAPLPYPLFEPEIGARAMRVLRAVPPGVMAAALHRIAASGEVEQAHSLAMRYRHAVAGFSLYELRSFANHLVYRIQEERPGKKTGRDQEAD